MSHDPLKAIEEELARQNEAFEQFKSTLDSLGDVELRIPSSFRTEIEEACAPRISSGAIVFGIKG